jgi:hypothetical protein
MPLVLSSENMSAWLAGEPPQLAEDIDDAVQVFPVPPQMNKWTGIVTVCPVTTLMSFCDIALK